MKIVHTVSKPPKMQIPNWLLALLLIFALSVLGLGLNTLTRSSVPFWLLLGFSTIFSVEKWFRKATLNKPIGKLYRLVLNLALLSILSLLIWSSFQLAAKQLASTPLISSIVFLAELVFLIWMWRKVAKNSWRFPSMKLTVFTLVCIALVFAFAGVPPLSIYKDNLTIKWEGYQDGQTAQRAEQEAEAVAEQQRQQAEQEAEAVAEQQRQQAELEREEAARLEAEAEAARLASLRNPSWAELKAFLLEDDTDKMKYIYPTVVCADFADKLQRNAEEAGWRCALVTVNLEGYPDWYDYGIPSDVGHALNAFETTDRGLVYIDCTRPALPRFNGSADKTIKLGIGKEYIGTSIFPTPNWQSVWESMGIVTSIDIKW